MANLEVIALDTVTPQLKAPQAGDGYAMPRPVTVTEVVGSTALTLTGATQTTAVPVLNATQTWNNAAITFTGMKFNVTNTASNAASLFMDLQVGGASRVSIGATTAIIVLDNGASGNVRKIVLDPSTGVLLRSDKQLAWTTSVNSSTLDAFITRKAVASLQLGEADAAAPVTQTIGPQSVVAGTSNTAGQNFTIRGSQGTGTGVGGDIIFQVAPAGSSGTAQNTLVQAMRIYNNKTVAVGVAYTVATLPAAGTQGRRAWVTDATAPTFLGALTGGGGVVCPVFDNGTAWVAG